VFAGETHPIPLATLSVARPQNGPPGAYRGPRGEVDQGDAAKLLVGSAGLRHPRGPSVRRPQDRSLTADDDAVIRIQEEDVVEPVRDAAILSHPRRPSVGRSQDGPLKSHHGHVVRVGTRNAFELLCGAAILHHPCGPSVGRARDEPLTAYRRGVDPVGEGWNQSYYDNPKFDELLDSYLAETDMAKRKEYSFAMQQMIAQDLPYAIMLRPDIIDPVRIDKFEGYVQTMGGVITWINPWTMFSIKPKK